MKWFNTKQDAAAILNDSWYLNLFGLICAPVEGQPQALVRELFRSVSDAAQQQDDEQLSIAGFASKSLSAMGVQALCALVRTQSVAVLDLSDALADGVEGAKALGNALPSW